jgi:hypothetical protein
MLASTLASVASIVDAASKVGIATSAVHRMGSVDPGSLLMFSGTR